MLALVSPAYASDLQALAEAEWGRREPAALVAAAPDDGKAELARGLGRLRSPEALEPLLALKGDPDPAVREAVAEALGWTPGAAPAIREWLDDLPPEEPVAGRPPLPAVPGVRPVLLASLGFHLDPADVPRLSAALGEAPAAASASAISLGRLGRAGVPEVKSAIPALVAALQRRDPVVSEAAAFALFRIGVAEASEADRAAISAWTDRPTPSARAWSLKAAWPTWSQPTRAEAFHAALKDSAALVRIGAIDAVGHDDVPVAELAALLRDKRPGIRSAALAALGRIGGDEAVALLRERVGSDDPWEAAAALTALSAWDGPPAERFFDPAMPEPVRAAAVGTLTDPARLEALALGDPQAAVRSAAVGALLDREAPPDPGLVRRLLAASDPTVREGAVALAEKLDPDVAKGLLGGAAPEVGRGAPPGVSGDLDDALAARSAVIRTDKGVVRVELYPDIAPLAVASFAALADRHFFDGLVFHRIVPGFVVQGGDPRGDGWGGPGYALPDEVSALPYDAGALGMARSERDTGGSQWFVTITPQPHLVGDYTLFGHVTSGMQVVNALERGDRMLEVRVERVP